MSALHFSWEMLPSARYTVPRRSEPNECFTSRHRTQKAGVMESNASRTIAPLSRRVLGSFLSALAGWIALVSLILSTAKPDSNVSSDMLGEFWGGVGLAIYLASLLMFLTWIFAILPLYLIVPLSSHLWRWYSCTICGAVGGAVIMLVVSCALLSSSESLHDCVRPCLVAAGVGWITCSFASITRQYFQYAARR